MSASDAAHGETTAAIRLRVVRAGELDIQEAQRELTDLVWLGTATGGPVDEPGMHRIAADLELAVREGSGAGPARKAGAIDLGPPEVTDDGLTVPVSWHSATFAPLFPVFVGQLRVGRGGLVVDGRYTPPFGRLGLVIDATLLRFIARRTAQAFLERVAAHFEAQLPADAARDP